MILILPVQELRADKFSNLLETLIKKPLRAADDLDRPLFRNLDAGKPLTRPNIPDDELLKQFNRLEGVNGEFRKTFKSLPKSQREMLVNIVSAGQRAGRGRDPNEALKLIRNLDSDGLLQCRTYGDFVYDGVDKMGSDYKTVVAKMGAGSGVFFRKYISPHWGKWTVAGLSAAYLSAPEKFHDKAGELTEYAIRKLVEAGIKTGESVGGGIWKAIVGRVNENPFFAIPSIMIIGFLLLIQVPVFRYFVKKLFQPLWKKPKNDPTTSGFKGTKTKSRPDYEE
jgi:hypothetical protein